jgi:cell division protein FtsA
MSDLYFTEIGSSKIATVRIQRLSFLKDKKVDIFFSESSGIVNGHVDDSQIAISAITRHVEGAEAYFGKPIRKTVLCLSDTNTVVKQTKMSIESEHRRIIDHDLENEVKRIFFEHFLDKENVVLHVLNDGFQIDDSDWMSNPLGFSGKRINARIVSIEAKRSYIREIYSLFSQSGTTVQRVVFVPFMMGYYVSRHETSAKSFAIIDLGLAKCDVILMQNGVIRKIHHIKIGGSHFTKDISHFSGFTRLESERIKLSLEKLKDRDEHQKMLHIVSDRIRELVRLIHSKMANDLFEVDCVFVTGGGSKIAGFTEALKSELQRDVELIPVDAQLASNAASFDKRDCGGLIASAIGSSFAKQQQTVRARSPGIMGGLQRMKSALSSFMAFD